MVICAWHQLEGIQEKILGFKTSQIGKKSVIKSSCQLCLERLEVYWQGVLESSKRKLNRWLRTVLDELKTDIYAMCVTRKQQHSEKGMCNERCMLAVSGIIVAGTLQTLLNFSWFIRLWVCFSDALLLTFRLKVPSWPFLYSILCVWVCLSTLVCWKMYNWQCNLYWENAVHNHYCLYPSLNITSSEIFLHFLTVSLLCFWHCSETLLLTISWLFLFTAILCWLLLSYIFCIFLYSVTQTWLSSMFGWTALIQTFLDWHCLQFEILEKGKSWHLITTLAWIWDRWLVGIQPSQQMVSFQYVWIWFIIIYNMLFVDLFENPQRPQFCKFSRLC